MTRKIIGALDVDTDHDVGGDLTVTGTTAAGDHLNLTPRSGAPTPNNTLFIDSADGYKLKIKDNTGNSSVIGNVNSATYISILENALNYDNNDTVRYQPSYMKTNPMTIDNADTKTNWTYVGASVWEYQNQQTSAATLQFDDLLSNDQKALLTSDTKKIMLIEKGNVWNDVVQDLTLVPNASFETGGGSPFATWTTTANAPTQDGSYIVTDGSFCAYWNMSYSTTSSHTKTTYGTLYQTIDVTNVDAIVIDCRGWNENVGASGGTQTWIRLTCGGIYDEEQFLSTETTSSLFIDVKSLTGNQTLTVSVLYSVGQTGFGTRTGRAGVDNIRVIKSDGTSTDTSRVTSISPDNGSTWYPITPGELTEIATPLTDLSVRVVETRTNADTTLYNTVSGYGVYWEDV